MVHAKRKEKKTVIKEGNKSIIHQTSNKVQHNSIVANDTSSSTTQVVTQSTTIEETVETKVSVKQTHFLIHEIELRRLLRKVLTLQYVAYSISNIRKWLLRMELELPSALDYNNCSESRKSLKIQKQQILYNEIEKYSRHVCHTFNLCRVLLQDKEVCRTEEQYSSLKEFLQELEPKWTYICSLFPLLSKRREIPAAGALGDLSKGSLCCKLCCILLPIYLLLLLLLFIAFFLLPPVCECENMWCFYRNSYRNSFNLMLDYPSGSPPV